MNAVAARRTRNGIGVGIPIALVVLAILAGCDSSTGASGSPSTTATSRGGCPFSGSTDTVTLPGPGIPSGTLTGIVADQSGCIDQVRLDLSPGVVPATIGYDVQASATTTTSGGTVQLVIRLGGPAAAAGEHTPARPAATVAYDGPATVPPRLLRHVKGIAAAKGADGEVDVFLALDAMVPFTTASTPSPANLVVSLAPSS
jgi:hypothetical protein